MGELIGVFSPSKARKQSPYSTQCSLYYFYSYVWLTHFLSYSVCSYCFVLEFKPILIFFRNCLHSIFPFSSILYNLHPSHILHVINHKIFVLSIWLYKELWGPLTTSVDPVYIALSTSIIAPLCRRWSHVSGTTNGATKFT